MARVMPQIEQISGFVSDGDICTGHLALMLAHNSGNLSASVDVVSVFLFSGAKMSGRCGNVYDAVRAETAESGIEYGFKISISTKFASRVFVK